MENIRYFDIQKTVDDKLVTFRKYLDVTTGQIVAFETINACNFTQLPSNKFNVKCVVFC